MVRLLIRSSGIIEQRKIFIPVFFYNMSVWGFLFFKLHGYFSKTLVMKGDCKMKKLGLNILHLSIFFSVSIVAVLLSGCQPSEVMIQTAMAETQSAMPTETQTIIPTNTQTNTPEPTFTPTETATLTPTYTPTPDLRVIELGPEVFYLQKDDLPQDAKYFLPNSTWSSPHRNAEVISGWGRDEGLDYLEKTGRIDGWVIYFARGTMTVRAPEQIFHNIVQYNTGNGPQLSLDIVTPGHDPRWVVIDDDYDLGDRTMISKLREMQPSGEYKVHYLVETAYRNYQSRVGAWGWEKEFDLEYVINLAEIALNKLMEAPLVDAIGD